MKTKKHLAGDDEGICTDEFQASILRGLADIKNGKLYTLEEVKARLGI